MRSNDAPMTRRSVRLAALAAACALPLGLTGCGSSSSHAGAKPSSAAAATSHPATTGSSAAAATTTGPARTTSPSASATTAHLASAKAVASTTSTLPTPTTRSVIPATQATPSTASAPAPSTTKRPAITRVDLAPVKSNTSGPTTGASATPRLAYTMSGRTLSYAFGAVGRQHQFKAEDGTVMSYPYPASATISFGDGTSDDGADAGMACLPRSPLSPLNGMSPRATHTYAKPGTYTVTVRSLFCGDSGATASTATYRITVR